MIKSDSTIITDPSGEPTAAEMDALWLARRAADLAELAQYERLRRFAVRTMFGHLDEVA